MKPSKVLLLSIAVATLMVLSLGETFAEPDKAQKVVYENDFEKAVGQEWSKRTLEFTPKEGRRFLGQFGSETVQLMLVVRPLSIGVSVDLSVAQGLDDFEDFSQRGEGPIVGPLVSVDGHDKLELLVGHFSLFGSPAVFLAADTWSSSTLQVLAVIDRHRQSLSPAIQTGTPVQNAASSVRIGTSVSSG